MSPETSRLLHWGEGSCRKLNVGTPSPITRFGTEGSELWSCRPSHVGVCLTDGPSTDWLASPHLDNSHASLFTPRAVGSPDSVFAVDSIAVVE